MRSKFANFIPALAIGLLATHDALACTRVIWASPDGQVLVGRTQDWTEKAGHAFRVFPRGIERVGAVAETVPSGSRARRQVTAVAGTLSAPAVPGRRPHPSLRAKTSGPAGSSRLVT